MGVGNSIQFIVIAVALLMGGNAAAVDCPPDYDEISDPPFCIPSLPTNGSFSEYYRETAVDNTQRPICGMNSSSARIPVMSNFEPLHISHRSFPYSLIQFRSDDYASGHHLETTRSTTDPTYLYSGLPRCACVPRDRVQPTETGKTNKSDSDRTLSNLLNNGWQRIYPDTYEVISSQTRDAPVRYNMVTMTNDPDAIQDNVDPRLGDLFRDGRSFCGCPNVNEQPENNGPAPAVRPDLWGVHCAPTFTDEHRILMSYDPVNNPQTLYPADQDGSDITQIRLPSSNGGSELYNRKIWTCAPPYTLNNGRCVLPTTSSGKHSCGTGSSDDDTSPVSPDISGSNKRAKFDNTVNKRLACCLNEFWSDRKGNIKFDCLDNSKVAYSSFETLWGSPNSDQSINAVALVGGSGKYITGFFTVDGSRCEEYSEFGGTIERGKIVLSQSTASPGGAQPTATGVAYNFVKSGNDINPPSQMNDIFAGRFNKSVPTSANDKKRCPILVRAAMISTCPNNPSLPAVQLSSDKFDNGNQTRCAAASSIQIKVRIEQIYEIAGMPSFKTVDTLIDQSLTSNVSVDRIIAQKTGNQCPPGTVRQGDSCVY